MSISPLHEPPLGTGRTNPRSVLVTGAGRGIGRAISVRLAHSGWQVYAGVRTDAAADELAAESDRITPVTLDVTDDEHIRALAGVSSVARS